MSTYFSKSRLGLAGFAMAAALLAGCSGMGSSSGASAGMALSLSGAQEVPPVNTAASGGGTIMVGADRAVSGRIATMGLNGTMAHIHMGAPGQNGPVIVPLTKSGNEWLVPAGAKLSDAQYDAYKAGNLYVNVHSDAFKGGEIRAQLKP